jgi:hypothetical protein
MFPKYLPAPAAANSASPALPSQHGICAQDGGSYAGMPGSAQPMPWESQVCIATCL